MVTANCTCEASGDTNVEEGIANAEDGYNDRDKDTEGSPGGSGCKGKKP